LGPATAAAAEAGLLLLFTFFIIFKICGVLFLCVFRLEEERECVDDDVLWQVGAVCRPPEGSVQQQSQHDPVTMDKLKREKGENKLIHYHVRIHFSNIQQKEKKTKSLSLYRSPAPFISYIIRYLISRERERTRRWCLVIQSIDFHWLVQRVFGFPTILHAVRP
jgi:hypothetical protein